MHYVHGYGERESLGPQLIAVLPRAGSVRVAEEGLPGISCTGTPAGASMSSASGLRGNAARWIQH